jgi:hypothetical protein
MDRSDREIAAEIADFLQHAREQSGSAGWNAFVFTAGIGENSSYCALLCAASWNGSA